MGKRSKHIHLYIPKAANFYQMQEILRISYNEQNKLLTDENCHWWLKGG